MQDPANTILLLHPPSLNPLFFISRKLSCSTFGLKANRTLSPGLIDLSPTLPEDTSTVPWRIDNKYYTANVSFHLSPISDGDEIRATRVPVVIYVFNGSVRSP